MSHVPAGRVSAHEISVGITRTSYGRFPRVGIASGVLHPGCGRKTKKRCRLRRGRHEGGRASARGVPSCDRSRRRGVDPSPALGARTPLRRAACSEPEPDRRPGAADRDGASPHDRAAATSALGSRSRQSGRTRRDAPGSAGLGPGPEQRSPGRAAAQPAVSASSATEDTLTAAATATSAAAAPSTPAATAPTAAASAKAAAAAEATAASAGSAARHAAGQRQRRQKPPAHRPARTRRRQETRALGPRARYQFRR